MKLRDGQPDRAVIESAALRYPALHRARCVVQPLSTLQCTADGRISGA